MRRTEELYDGKANPVSKKAYTYKGKKILCESSTSGVRIQTGLQYIDWRRHLELISIRISLVEETRLLIWDMIWVRHLLQTSS